MFGALVGEHPGFGAMSGLLMYLDVNVDVGGHESVEAGINEG